MRPLRAALLGADRPSLDLNFAALRQLDPRITFTRASSATFIGPTGLVETASTNVPRFTHDPITGQSLGFWPEEARTNLLLRSEEVDNAGSWANASNAITANAGVSPSGASNAESIVPTATLGAHFVAQSVAFVSGTAYTASFYVKANGYSAAGIVFTSGAFGSNIFCNFNLLSGVANASGGTAAVSIVSAGNGWFRCIATATATATISASPQFRVLSAYGVGDLPFSGDGTSGLFVWGAQLEAGASPTSYIPTTGAAALRAADVATITGTNFSQWYRQDEGTIAWEGQRLAAVTNAWSGGVPRFFDISDGTTANLISGIGSPAEEFVALIRLAATVQLQFAPGASAGEVVKMACSYGGNALSAARLGAVNTASAIPPAVNRLDIGNRFDGTRTLNGTIARLRYWPRRLPDSTLQRLTAL